MTETPFAEEVIQLISHVFACMAFGHPARESENKGDEEMRNANNLIKSRTARWISPLSCQMTMTPNSEVAAGFVHPSIAR
jgi:hypothetical protein